jgi:hypothetical protein
MRSFRFSVILYYAREIDSPIGCWGINFPFVTQNDGKLQISQGYIIRILPHFTFIIKNTNEAASMDNSSYT